MTFEQIGASFRAAAEELGLNFGYAPFRHGKEPEVPYLAYSYPGKNNFHGDNKPYVQISRIYIYLVTKEKDIDLENAIEAKLQEIGVNFTMDSDFYEETDAFVATFETEEIIND